MTTINFCRIFIIPLHTTPGDFFLKNRPTCDCVLSCILKFMLFHKSLTTATVALAHVMIADAVTHRAYVGTILFTSLQLDSQVNSKSKHDYTCGSTVI